jgi:predicted Zn-dependent peptidase
MTAVVPLHTMSVGEIPLVVESVSDSSTVTVAWLLPVGSAGDPIGAAGEGESAMLAEVILRGAGSRDSRAFCDALDLIGVQRGTASAMHHIAITATCLAEHMPQMLELLTDMIRRPHIGEDAVEAARDLALQTLGSLRDDPQHYVSMLLGGIVHPAPFNRHGYGTEEGLKACTQETLRAAWSRRARPGGSIIGVVGGVDAPRVQATLASLLADWSGRGDDPCETAPPRRGTCFERQESAQTHMCIGLPAPKESDSAGMLHRLAVRVLGGGGMANRLFSEVRERRGLCYSVGMSYAAGRERGLSTIYAGSTPDRAKQTIECIRGELRRMVEGVSPDEFERAIIGLKSSTIMNGERSSARASSIAGDIYRIGRARTLAEVVAQVDALTIGAVNEYCRSAFSPTTVEAASLAIVGPEPL